MQTALYEESMICDGSAGKERISSDILTAPMKSTLINIYISEY